MKKFHCVRCDNLLRPEKIPTGYNQTERITCFFCDCHIVIHCGNPNMSANITGWCINFNNWAAWSIYYWTEERRKIVVVPIANKDRWWDYPLGDDVVLPYVDPKELTEERIETWLLLR